MPKGQRSDGTNLGGAVAKTRPDDARGRPRPDDRAAAPPGHPGNPPFVATDAQRAQVRALAKTVRHDTPIGQGVIAARLGISVSTLRRHFQQELDQGRAEIIATMGAMMVRAATDPKYAAEMPREQMHALQFTLARLGGWSTRVEVGGPGGGAVPMVDLSGMSPEALAEYGRQSAIDAGLDPDALVPAPG